MPVRESIHFLSIDVWLAAGTVGKLHHKKEFTMTLVLHLVSWIGGSLLIGLEFGWKIGLATWFLSWYVKSYQ